MTCDEHTSTFAELQRNHAKILIISNLIQKTLRLCIVASALCRTSAKGRKEQHKFTQMYKEHLSYSNLQKCGWDTTRLRSTEVLIILESLQKCGCFGHPKPFLGNNLNCRLTIDVSLYDCKLPIQT
jgi:hypothetical protein